MGVCDAKYTFTSVSVGNYGSQSDGGIFRLSSFGQSVMGDKVPVLVDKPLCPIHEHPFPHYFIGDAAFPLKRNLMRPYAGSNLDTVKTVYNYRLSRTRRVIENCFGILCARWRVLLTTTEMSPDNVDIIVLACTVLHNFIMLSDQTQWYCPESYVGRELEDGTLHEGDWRRQLGNNGDRPMRSFTIHIPRSTQTVMDLRNNFAEHFN